MSFCSKKGQKRPFWAFAYEYLRTCVHFCYFFDFRSEITNVSGLGMVFFGQKNDENRHFLAENEDFLLFRRGLR